MQFFHASTYVEAQVYPPKLYTTSTVGVNNVVNKPFD